MKHYQNFCQYNLATYLTKFFTLLIASSKISERRRTNLTVQVLWVTAGLLAKRFCSLIYPLDKGTEIAWGHIKNFEFGRLELGTKNVQRSFNELRYQ